MGPASSPPTSLVLVKHALPVRDPAVAPRHWRLGLEGEHQSRRLASRLFAYAPLRLAESGRDALTRFSAAVVTELAQTDAPNLVAITHGTVISLFVAAHNDIDGFELWKQLACPSFVVLKVDATRCSG